METQFFEKTGFQASKQAAKITKSTASENIVILKTKTSNPRNLDLENT